jgi:hypothetical protein
MVMIVKKHEKKWRGFISVTRDSCATGPGLRRGHWKTAGHGRRTKGPVTLGRRAQLAAERWSRPRPQERKTRTFALLVHCSEQ